MKNIKLVLSILCIAIITYCCNKDYLDKRALGQLDEPSIANKRGVEGLLIGAYSMLDGESSTNGDIGSAGSNWIYGSICGSEAYKGSVDNDLAEITALERFEPAAGNSDLASKWSVVYDGVERANKVLRIMREAKDMTTEDTTEVKAEALFLRAWYHLEAKKMWNNIPYVDETISYGAGNYHIPNDTAWLPFENDLQYAVNNLPEKQPEIGRANLYAAKALLAKVYMFEHKYAQAQPLLRDIITNGVTSLGDKYDLVNYADNFNPERKNSLESIFAAQTSVNDNAGGANGNAGDLYNFPTGGPSSCCSFFQPSQYFVNHFKTDPNTGLPDLDNYNVIDVTIDTGGTDSFTPYLGSLDPRLDWTVGRRGIPYLDWGIDPGADFWVRDPKLYGPYSPKKNVYAKSQQASFTDAGWSNFVANNINLIRFADVLLWAAEVEIENGSLDEAEKYVNRVRNRMADHHEYWVHKYLDDNNPEGGFYTDDAHLAANYVVKPYPDGSFASHGREYARKAVRYERMLELGMEGQRFFDLVRWGIAETEINTYLEKEKDLRSYLIGANFRKGCNEYFPIPQLQIDLSAGADGIKKMVQNPCF